MTSRSKKAVSRVKRSDVPYLNIHTLSKNVGRTLLLLAGVGALVSIAVVAPALPAALSELSDVFEKTPRFRRNQVLRRLKKQRLVEINERDGITSVSLTEKGKQQILSFNIEHLQVVTPKLWDRKWRIIIFDIPEEFRRARQALHMKMRELNFYPLQKSVFVYPFPCKNEIDFIADFFGVGRYLNYIEATYLDDESFLKHHFQLTV